MKGARPKLVKRGLVDCRVCATVNLCLSLADASLFLGRYFCQGLHTSWHSLRAHQRAHGVLCVRFTKEPHHKVCDCLGPAQRQAQKTQAELFGGGHGFLHAQTNFDGSAFSKNLPFFYQFYLSPAQPDAEGGVKSLNLLLYSFLFFIVYNTGLTHFTFWILTALAEYPKHAMRLSPSYTLQFITPSTNS